MSGIRTLDGFFDSLVQSFENCRGGLNDEALKSGTGVDEPFRFFSGLYEKEIPRLLDVIRLEEPHLPLVVLLRIAGPEHHDPNHRKHRCREKQPRHAADSLPPSLAKQ